jgi:hypothetical protein
MQAPSSIDVADRGQRIDPPLTLISGVQVHLLRTVGHVDLNRGQSDSLDTRQCPGRLHPTLERAVNANTHDVRMTELHWFDGHHTEVPLVKNRLPQ